MTKPMNFKHLLFIALSFVFFVACTGDSDIPADREMKSYMASYLNDNSNVIAFGNAKLKTILSKADATSVDKVGVLVEDQLNQLDGLINLDDPMYYSINGPLKADNSPESVTLLLEVEDKKGLEDKLMEMGYDLNEVDGINVGGFDDMNLGIRGNLAVIVVKGGDYDSEELMKAEFARIDADEISGTLADMIEDDGDVVMSMHMTNLMNSSSKVAQDLTKDQMSEMKSLLKDSYIQTNVKFEDGVAIVETKNLFSPELMKRMPFKNDGSASIRSNLGSGEPRAGFSMNIDFDKLEALLYDFGTDEVNEAVGMPMMAASFATGGASMGQMLSGDMGVVIFTDEDAMGLAPEFNAYVGLGEKGKEIGSLASSYLSMGTANVDVQDRSISLATSKDHKGNGPLSVPNDASSFGKSGLSFFMNLEDLDPDDIADMVDLGDFTEILKVAKFISFDYNNDGGTLRIVAKDGKENVLKQAMEVVVDKFKDQISKAEIAF